MVKCKIEWRSQSGIGNWCQITFNQSIRVCYKSKAFLLLRFESSGRDSMRNLSHYVCFLRRKWKGFWNSKVAEIYGVTDSFWRIRSSSLIDIFMQGKMGCQYHGGTHFEYNWNQSVGTNDSNDKKKDDYQTVVLEPENEEDVEREKKSIRQNRFTNRLGHTCSYCNRLINSPFCTFLKSKYTSTKKIPLLFSDSQAKKIRQ